LSQWYSFSDAQQVTVSMYVMCSSVANLWPADDARGIPAFEFPIRLLCFGVRRRSPFAIPKRKYLHSWRKYFPPDLHTGAQLVVVLLRFAHDLLTYCTVPF
jgi:hypothetical protein